MKIALLSDIHSNLEALLAVLEDAREYGVDEFVCAGDLVDYGPNPNEVIKEAIDNKFITVMGNHDQGVGLDLEPTAFKIAPDRNIEDELIALAWTQQKTTSVNKKYLLSLPIEVLLDREGYRILLTHALPSSLTSYIGPGTPDKLEELHAQYRADIYVLGHLHIPYKDMSADAVFINPGSVGKPKDLNADASYAILDLRTGMSVEFRKVKYDIETTMKKMAVGGLPQSLADALLAGE